MTLDLPQPVFDANASGGGFGDLPDWDLTDLYPSADGPEFAADMAELERACAAFAKTYEGRLGRQDAAGLLACVQEYERIEVIAGRLMSYAGLRYYQNTIDPERAQFMGNAQDKVTMPPRRWCSSAWNSTGWTTTIWPG
jgi:oligoendopeptidase F